MVSSMVCKFKIVLWKAVIFKGSIGIAIEDTYSR